MIQNQEITTAFTFHCTNTPIFLFITNVLIHLKNRFQSKIEVSYRKDSGNGNTY